MSDTLRIARRFGLSVLVGFSVLLFGLSGVAWAQGYIPDGPNVPVITLNESQRGAAGLRPLRVPPPRGFDQESIWNMEVVGFNDNQGRASSDDGWVENQNGRYILYVTNNGSGVHHFNPLTGQIEKDGTSLIDVTNPRHPVFVSHIPSTAGSATHLAVCGGNTLPNGEKNHWYLLRHDGSRFWEIWDTADPSHPTTVGAPFLTNGTATHHAWWECDTGIAYLISGIKGDGWHAAQHVYIYDLSVPKKPVFIRQWGLVGQQPAADVATQESCYTAPSSTCFEGVTNPPGEVHQQYSGGTIKNRVYFAYGVSSDGVFQVVDREKLLTGCTAANPNASADCANHPTQADLLYPQVSYVTTNPNQGGHTAIPIFGIPIPESQQNFLDGTPQKWDLLAVTSEDTTNDCLGQPWKNIWLLDITNDIAPWNIATLPVGQFPGNFCAKGSRFGTHEINREINKDFYGRLIIVAWFNAGLQVWDIRDPYSPRRVAYFIQAPNSNTQSTCGTYQGNTNYCRNATFSDLGEVDDRGYIYNLDRAGSGVTILKLTGDALKVVTGEGDDEDDEEP